MASNTKLSPDEKQYVEDYCRNINPEFYHNEKITIMIREEFKDSRMVAVSMSTMSPDEKKFRKSVGRYYAISSFENGQYVLMDRVTAYRLVNMLSYW